MEIEEEMALERVSKTRILSRIFTILDQGPCYAYEIMRMLGTDYGDLRFPTLYRWLYELEKNHIVTSETRPGLKGPERKFYRLTTEGQLHMTQLLRDAIDLVLHYYEDYQQYFLNSLSEFLSELDYSYTDGRILFLSYPRITYRDLELLNWIKNSIGEINVDIIGDMGYLVDKDPRIRILKGDLCNIRSSRGRYREVWLCRTPKLDDFAFTVSECKRVLASQGVLRIILPHIIFDEPSSPGLDEFIKITSFHMFPELQVMYGKQILRVIETYFSTCGYVEPIPGTAIFWAVKE
jgi:DNA-binding PadR family transcriptional regulator